MVSDFGFDDAKYFAAVVSSPFTSAGALDPDEQHGRRAGGRTPYAAFFRGVTLVGFFTLDEMSGYGVD